MNGSPGIIMIRDLKTEIKIPVDDFFKISPDSFCAVWQHIRGNKYIRLNAF